MEETENEEHSWNEYSFTEDGAIRVLNIISEFCHGFNITEIANLNPDIEDPDEIKVLMMMLCIQAGIMSAEED